MVSSRVLNIEIASRRKSCIMMMMMHNKADCFKIDNLNTGTARNLKGLK